MHALARARLRTQVCSVHLGIESVLKSICAEKKSGRSVLADDTRMLWGSALSAAASKDMCQVQSFNFEKLSYKTSKYSKPSHGRGTMDVCMLSAVCAGARASATCACVPCTHAVHRPCPAACGFAACCTCCVVMLHVRLCMRREVLRRKASASLQQVLVEHHALVATHVQCVREELSRRQVLQHVQRVRREAHCKGRTQQKKRAFLRCTAARRWQETQEIGPLMRYG